ncbi:SLC13 family permease [Chelatococcus asaccharovorans]|uniref:SLC13 family permease n=1 Tax=Chelatococcus asaccharovorans TaxID=28210 RepID=UPI00224C66C2|nr:SLC13 family permease [Chelatococcus asaccharovorans]CAH1659195.1 Di/tricarboxylate transporter [Chelatococcus asaccharovorans]CAH1688107.1 Di/tricarboxylate transporter [Chelatococcus asaccharovorans]
MSAIESTALITAITIALFAWNRLPVIVVALGAALALWAAGVVTLEQALAGFGDRAVMFIASLFIVSAALEKTGVTAWAGQLLIAKAGENRRARLLIIIMTAVGCLSALISGGGAVAALIPVVVMAAIRLRQSPSQLLMPLAFAAHAGSNLLLTGAPKNILVSEALEDAGLKGFAFAEFALVGLPLLAGTMAIILILGRRLLPEKTSARLPADFSRHAQTLVEHYGLSDGVFRLRVRATSPYVGRSPADLDIADSPRLALMAVQAGASGLPLRAPTIATGDYLLVKGEAEAVANLAAEKHLALRESGTEPDSGLFNRRSGLAEVVIPPRSALIGRIMFPGMITDSGDLVVLAVQRAGVDLEPGDTVQAGDTLLLEGSWEALDLNLEDPDVLVVNSPDLVRRQAVPMGAGAGVAVTVLAGLVILLATGIVPPAVAGLSAACLLILTGILTVEEAYRAINWTTVILVGAMMPLSVAMVQSGAAQRVADHLVGLTGDAGPTVFLAGLFVLTAGLGQIMSNTATTMLVIPIAMASANGMGVSPRPILMSLCIAGAASFLTPIATATNMMVMGPGGYSFTSYWKLGTPLMLWFFVMAVFYVPLVWRF